MFVLAHLSDPHLGPLPTAASSELAGKRATGFFNWRRKRHRIHRADVLARIVGRSQGAGGGPHRGDRRPRQHLARRANTRRRARGSTALGPPRDVTLVPGNHDAYVRAAARYPQLHWGEYMRGDEAGETAFPFVRRRGPLVLIGLSSAVPTAPFMATGRLGASRSRRLPRRSSATAAKGAFASS